MAFLSYIVAADFHIRADAIDTMKQLIAEVTAPSLDEDGCQTYHWSQGADDPTLFLLYMEWRDKACFEAHVARTHVKHAEDRLKRENMLVEPAREWHFYRLIDGPQARGCKKC
jgi:quinol monooxygenase YgiN